MNDDIVFNDAHHGFIISKEAGHVFNPKADQVISRTLDNELVGGVVYSQWTGENASVAMHMAGFDPRWIVRDLIWACFDYPFNQLKVKKIFATFPETNAHARQLNERFGFLRPIVIKDVFDDGDMIVLEMYRSECKWLTLKPKRFGR